MKKGKTKKVVTVVFEPDGCRVRVAPRTTMFEAANRVGIGIRSECGGKGICGKCRVVVQDKNALNEVTATEMKHLSLLEIDSGYRLACQARVKQSIVAMIPPESRVGALRIEITGLERPVPLNPLVKKFHTTLPKPTSSNVRPDYERLLDCLKCAYRSDELEIDYELLKKLPKLLRDANWDVTVTIWNDHRIIAVEAGDTTNKLFGSAIDIGTSKIIGYVVDLLTGKTVGIGSAENPQVLYGEDIISRIAFAVQDEDKLRALQRLVTEGINDVLRLACAEAGVNPDSIYEATVVGNTAMHHLFLGIQPKYVALPPFTPAVRRPMGVKARELDVKMHRNGVIYVLPVIAGFVGADALGDVLSSGISQSKELTLLIDIGTNTEVFVGNAEDILSCSCASGPAFEGAHIKHGMKAVNGAIKKVRISPDSYEVVYEVIGDVKPVGLCGSAMVDVVAEMLRCSIISHRGRFNLNVKTPRLKRIDSDVEFVVAWNDETGSGKEITVTQSDINEIQLAKAAIFTGCSILMMRKNLRRLDLDRVLIAGTFGRHISPTSARFIGLIPEVPTKKVRFVGNAAVTGAKMALISREARETASMLSNRIRYLELTTDPSFDTEFAQAMFLPHKDLNRFQAIRET